MDQILPPHLSQLLVDVLHRLRLAHDRIADLESERDIYRDMAKAGIEALHHVTTERDGLRRSNQRIHEEYRKTTGSHSVSKRAA